MNLGNITHTHLMALFSGSTHVSRYQKGKTNLDFTEARDSEWQWHQLGHMQVCNSFQTDNHASTPPLSFLQAGCPSCRPTNSIKALKATSVTYESRTTPGWLTTLGLVAVVLNEDVLPGRHANVAPVNARRIAQTRVVCDVNVAVADFT